MLPDGYIIDNERIIKHHGERNNVYFGDNFYMKSGVVHELDKRTEIILDNLIYNNETKTLSNPANLDDAFIDAFKQETEGKKIRIDKDKKTKHIHVFANGTEILETCDGQIVNLNFPSVTEIGNVDRNSILARFMGGLPNLKRVKGSLSLSGLGLTELPDLSHVVVDGSFYCAENQLTTLKGSPKRIKGNFYCYDNQLTTLLGGPWMVEGSFDCADNRLTTLEGSPRIICGNFDCSRNQLTTLEGSPKIIGGHFRIDYNQLSTYNGAPWIIVEGIVGYESGLDKTMLLNFENRYDGLSGVLYVAADEIRAKVKGIKKFLNKGASRNENTSYLVAKVKCDKNK